MDESISKLFSEAIKNGYGIPFIIWFLWEKKIQFSRKKSGDWVSWKDLKFKMDRISDHLKYVEEKVSAHLEKEAMEDIKVGKMEVKIENFDEFMAEMKKTRDNIYALLSDIKDKMIEMAKK